MQGRRTGVATRILQEQPAAIPVHCLAHSLNLCLQGAARKLPTLRDALELYREIYKLIELSPKRYFLFASNLAKVGSEVGLKPLCPTRWTVRAIAIDAILKNYCVLIEILEEIHVTTRNEYGLKALGFLHSLESFSTLLGLQLSHKLFCVAEQISLVLQNNSLTIQDALSTVNTAKAYYCPIRTDDEFDHFYDGAMKDAEKHAIGKPVLPRYRRRPSKLDDGALPHQFPSAKAYFRHIYFEACELMPTELERRFDHQHISSVVAIEQTMLKAANGCDFHDEITTLEHTCFKKILRGLV